MKKYERKKESQDCKQHNVYVFLCAFKKPNKIKNPSSEKMVEIPVVTFSIVHRKKYITKMNIAWWMSKEEGEKKASNSFPEFPFGSPRNIPWGDICHFCIHQGYTFCPQVCTHPFSLSCPFLFPDTSFPFGFLTISTFSLFDPFNPFFTLPYVSSLV